MILLELYAIRALVVDASLDSDEVKEAKKKIDSFIALISNAPASDTNMNFPKTRLRR